MGGRRKGKADLSFCAASAGFHYADCTPRRRETHSELQQLCRSGEYETGRPRSRHLAAWRLRAQLRALAGRESTRAVQPSAGLPGLLLGGNSRLILFHGDEEEPTCKAAVGREADGFSQPGRTAQICHPHCPSKKELGGENRFRNLTFEALCSPTGCLLIFLALSVFLESQLSDTSDVIS